MNCGELILFCLLWPSPAGKRMGRVPAAVGLAGAAARRLLSGERPFACSASQERSVATRPVVVGAQTTVRHRIWDTLHRQHCDQPGSRLTYMFAGGGTRRGRHRTSALRRRVRLSLLP